MLIPPQILYNKELLLQNIKEKIKKQLFFYFFLKPARKKS